MITYFYLASAWNRFHCQHRQMTPLAALRECDEIREILTPCVFHAVRQQDYAFW
jgi:hypothetical protein